MASPFAVFRKYQKSMLVVVGILCMFAFVVLPPILDMQSQRSARKSQVVVTTKYGELREPDLAEMLRNRHMVNLFLREVVLTTVAVMQQENPLPASEAQIVRFKLSRLQQQGMLQPASEESVVETMILANKAQQLGLRISDQAINDFLRVVSENKVSADQFAAILKRLQISSGRLFDALRTELLATRLRELFASGLQATPPAERFEYYKRLKQQATIQAAPIPVANFTDQVADPDESTLIAFFEEHKYAFPDPRSPDPGFRQPPKVAVQYFKAEYDKLVESIEVSDEEIVKYYEEHKEQYRNPALRQPAATVTEPEDAPQEEARDGQSTPSETDASANSNSPDEGTSSATSSTTDSSSSSSSSKTSPENTPSASESQPDGAEKESSSDEQAEKNEANAGENNSDTTSDSPGNPPSETPSDNQSREDSEAPAQDTPEENSSSDTTADHAANTLALAPPAVRGMTFDLNALKAADGETDDAQQQNDSQGDASSSDRENTDASDEAPADSSTDASESADSDEAETGDAEQANSPKYVLPGEYVLPRDIRDQPQWEYEPLWSRRNGKTLRERIAEQLKRERVSEHVEAIFAELADRMNQYKYQWEDWQDEKLENPDAPAPKPLNFAALAESYKGVSAHETDLLSLTEMQQTTDIGRSFIEGGTPFVNYVYQSGRLYTPADSVDFDGNRYLFWKTAETGEKVPEFDEVRDQVLAAWKIVQAREPALAEARRIAEEAKSSGKPLAEALADRSELTVFTTGPFSWMREPSFENQIRGMTLPEINEVDGIDAPGDEFMRTVFELEPGQIDTAMNAPQTVVYVVQVQQLSPPDEELRATFLVDSFQRFAGAAAIDRFRAQREWIEELKREAGVHWVRAPDAPIAKT